MLAIQRKTKQIRIIFCIALCICLLITTISFSVMSDEILVPAEAGVGVVGIQVSENPSETTSVRFIGKVDNLEYAKVGFLISSRWRDSEGNYHTGQTMVDKGTTVVYRSILADGKTVTAEELGATYLMALTVSNVPVGEGVTVEFTVTPYSVETGKTLAEKNYMRYVANSATYSFVNGQYSKTTEPLSSFLAWSEGTSIRVMHSNVKSDPTTNELSADEDYQRAELLLDTYLTYAPDIITFNELNPGGRMPGQLKTLLAPYYTILDGMEYLDLYDDSESTNTWVAQRKYGFPIAYRKDAGLTLIDSGFSYHSKMEYFHGTAWAVFEKNGMRFLVASNHLAENVVFDENESKVTSTIWAEEVMQIVKVATDRYGNIPMILNGDWYFAQNLRSEVYQYMIDQGLEDVSETAEIKQSVGVGTFHDLGVEQTNRVEEDIVFASGFKALQHGIVVDYNTVNASDHYPVVADLQFFNAPLKAQDPGLPLSADFLQFGF